MGPAEAFAECGRITRAQAKNFSYGIRLLPPDKRAALSAVYALARRIDDIGDGDAPAERKLAELQEVRLQIESLARGEAAPHDDAVLVAVADAAARYPLPLLAFEEVVRGCERDCDPRPVETFEELVEYCRLVAGSIGRLSLTIFGTKDMASAEPLADTLGVALQLTNILRDVLEDRSMGRCYLPREDLVHFGCEELLADRGPPSCAALGSRGLQPGDVHADRVRGDPGRRLVRPRSDAHAHARSSQQSVRGCHGRHLPATPSPNSGGPLGRSRGKALALQG